MNVNLNKCFSVVGLYVARRTIWETRRSRFETQVETDVRKAPPPVAAKRPAVARIELDLDPDASVEISTSDIRGCSGFYSALA